jgi:hypothetical protein
VAERIWPWFRLYIEVIEDRKLRRLPPAQRWVWIALLCAARKSPVAGIFLLSENVPGTLDDLADIAAIPLKDVQEAVAVFQQQDMVSVEGGVLVVTHWKERQFESDDSTARWRRWRDKHKSNVGANVGQTLGQRSQRSEAEAKKRDPSIDGSSADADGAVSGEAGKQELSAQAFCEAVMASYNEIFESLWARPLRLTDDRKAKILARRKGYSLDDLKQAIINVRCSAFHCGDNDRNQVYATPEFIFRNDGMVDKWLNVKQQTGGKPCLTDPFKDLAEQTEPLDYRPPRST